MAVEIYSSCQVTVLIVLPLFFLFLSVLNLSDGVTGSWGIV